MKKISITILTILFCLTSNVGWSADFKKGLTAYKSGDYATAQREWKPLAEQGNTSAQVNLGIIFHLHKKDYKTAMKWYRLAAKQGVANAEANLGDMYRKGQGVPQDYKTAVKWYRLAAQHGDKNAQGLVTKLDKMDKEMADLKKVLKASARDKRFFTNLECFYTVAHTTSVNPFEKPIRWSIKPARKMKPQRISFRNWKTTGNNKKVDILHHDKMYKGSIINNGPEMVTIKRTSLTDGDPFQYSIIYTIYKENNMTVKSRQFSTAVAPNTETWWGNCKRVE